MADELHAVVSDRLKGVEQRYTSGRRALIDALARLDRPATAAELVSSDKRLVQSTTYRNLAVLEQAGVVHRIAGNDDFARFELAEELTGRHHHHLVCLKCGAVEDFDPPRRVERGLDSVAVEVQQATGFHAEAHRLDLLGTCAACSR